MVILILKKNQVEKNAFHSTVLTPCKVVYKKLV